MRSRTEHLDWSKARALQYLDAGELSQSFASMGSDLSKHPELGLPALLGQIGMLHLMNGDTPALRRWIEGFN